MWTDDQLSLLIAERRNRNADYHNIPGSSRVSFWNDIANIINERFSTNYTGYQCKGKFQNLVRDHTVIDVPIHGSTTPKTNKPNASKTSKSNASKTSKSNASKTSKSNVSKTNNRKDSYDDSTYDPLEDDDYNVDEGRPLDNLSRENLEWEEENDDNDYRNPGKRQEMLDQM
ncbi:10866_t:CDS:2 [Gigaspora margarita]|uniref:10866_t:CDS:1 n=1 Tax=Gigaspora margarita TaxID=4874 RepID=A0ABN7VVR6_GIGMA|nr:10866_t:CDS:2 [Gigaspora margarita]